MNDFLDDFVVLVDDGGGVLVRVHGCEHFSTTDIGKPDIKSFEVVKDWGTAPDYGIKSALLHCAIRLTVRCLFSYLIHHPCHRCEDQSTPHPSS
jgi:hypothetical protein